MVRAVTPIPFVKARFFDRCGKPLAGGKVYTYEANTTTPKVTYKDPYGLTPNTNPIILDAAGEADIYLDGTYRIRITDRNDVLVNDVEKIGSWFSDNLQDTLDNISGAMDDALKPILQNLDNAINAAAAAAAGANGWTAELIVDGEFTQQQINAAQRESVIYIGKSQLNSIDNTPFFDKLIANVPNNAKIVFPFSEAIKGHFISENKALNVDLNGCTLINTVDNKPLIKIGTLTVNTYNVTESVLNHGDTQFTVANASNLFKIGDIGYLWDGATRATGGSVNFETIKIKAISGDVITVENFLASYKGASAIKFYHEPNQLKNASIKNGFLKPTPTHTAVTSLIANIENPQVENIETHGTTGVAVSVRYCYNAQANNIRPFKAMSVASGEGYGLQMLGVTQVKATNINGSGMRHVYDQDSTYFFDISNVSDYDDKSACVGLAHDGFAGYGTLSKVRCITSQYPVVMSEHGYAGLVPALKQNHPFRNIHVSDVNATIRADVDITTSTTCFGVYFQNNVVDCSVDNLSVNVLGPDSITEKSGSCLVRVNGVINKGLKLSNLKANKIGKVFFGSGGARDGFAADKTQVVIDNVQVDSCACVYHAQGLYYISLNNVLLGNAPLSAKIGYMQVTGTTDRPIGVAHGNNIDYMSGQGVAQLDCNAPLAIAGSLQPGQKTSANGVTVIDGQTLTINELQEKSAFLKLNSPIGTGSITVDMPKPQTVGDEVFITVLASRYTVVLGGDNVNGTISIAANNVVRLKVVGSKWSIVGRNSAI